MTAAAATLVLLATAAGSTASAPAPEPEPAPEPTVTPPVFVSVQHAARLIATSGATVLDARGSDASPPYVPDAQVVSWSRAHWRPRGEANETFTATLLSGLRSLAGMRTGRLADDVGSVAKDLAGLGVHSDRPVIVYGAMANGWGEEGRIWWMLAYLGHPAAHILDGGIAAWRTAGLPTAPQPSGSTKRGAFTPRLRPELRATRDQVLAASRNRGALILDSRRREEYDGATPYLSARGGHVPGALHLYWKDVIAPSGLMRSPTDLRALLRDAGVAPGRPVLAYCTGGVRSGFLVAALHHVGLRAANYDGSWWEWAAAVDLPVQRSR